MHPRKYISSCACWLSRLVGFTLTIKLTDDTIKYIHTDMKSYIDKNETTMKAMNDHITSMLATLIDTNFNTKNQDEKITFLSSKISTYEYRLEKMSNEETHLQPLSLQSKMSKMRKPQSFHKNYTLMKTA